ncbi:alpha/beta fold hydrolase [Thalassotalea mangrovi]|uniref:Alpha/beta fold hydrolase n=1 Tax=Thalassotalea mangrovi TaxID=2572245 RepID=A0A4U1B5C6_9GAMM|nr:alpha/beta fold hydrolase [Thalassotalea mangrovi]TKB45627.1 alpha/beta fold hydrolase [Thalassotalea mangrovi]
MTTLLNFQRAGSGATVLLIHGLFGALENLNALAKSLQKEFDVIQVDVRNHGDSFHNSSMSYNDLANDIFYLLDHLNIKKCHFFGHSMGGKIAMQCALTDPDRCLSLIVADIAPVQYPPHHNEILAGLNAVKPEQLTQRRDADEILSRYVSTPGVRQFLLKNLVKTDSGYRWRASIDNISKSYDQISMPVRQDRKYQGPVLFIKGENSDYITSEHRPTIAKLFPTARARVITGTGHWLHAEKPQEFNRIVSQFIEKNQD